MTENKHIYDAQFEEILTQAMKRCHQSEMDRLPPEGELDGEVVFSWEHQRRMERIFADLRSSQKRRFSNRLARIMVTAALIAGMLFASVAVYSYFNPLNAVFPDMKSLMNAGVGHAVVGSKWVDYTDRVTRFADVEEMERLLSNGAMYPRLAETDFVVSDVCYSEYLNYSLAEISIEGDCSVLIYFDSALYREEQFPESSRMEIGERTCYLIDFEGTVQIVMMENDVTYVVRAPEQTRAEALIRSIM